jgi:flagellar motor switch protein FliN
MSATWTEQRLSHWFVLACADQFGDAFRAGPRGAKSVGGPLVPGEPHPEVWKAWTDPVWYSAQAGVKKGAALFIGCGRETALALSGVEEGGEAVSSGSDLTLYEELLNQAIVTLEPLVEREVGKLAQFSAIHSDDCPSVARLGFEYRFGLADAVHLLAVVPSAALLDAVILAEQARSAELDVNDFDTLGARRGTGENEMTPAASENLQMLMDVDLDLSVSFGKTRLLLQDVLKLASGSIVELNRSASDPVEVLVNNSVVARGEVVVVDGNYGIRVTEVVSQSARLRSVM